MVQVNVKKAVGRRKTAAYEVCSKVCDCATDLRHFFAKADEQKKSANGLTAVYDDVREALGEAAGNIEAVVAAFADICKHNDICQFGAVADEEGGGAGAATNEPHTSAIGTSIAELKGTFEHLVKRLQRRAQADAMKSFVERAARMKQVLAELQEHAIAWRGAIEAYLESPAFTVPFSAPDSTFDIYPDEVTGTKQQKREFLSKIDGYAPIVEASKADRAFVLDEKKFDITGTRYADADRSSADSDSDGSVNSIDYDLASDEIDPDDVLESDTEEDSFTDSEQDSAEVSQATGIFEANISAANRDIVAEAERRVITRGQRRLRAGGFRKTLDRLVPLLERAKTGEYDAVRSEKRRRIHKPEDDGRRSAEKSEASEEQGPVVDDGDDEEDAGEAIDQTEDEQEQEEDEEQEEQEAEEEEEEEAEKEDVEVEVEEQEEEEGDEQD
jgi:hypothetical protein